MAQPQPDVDMEAADASRAPYQRPLYGTPLSYPWSPLVHPMPFRSCIECRPKGLIHALQVARPPSYQESQRPSKCFSRAAQIAHLKVRYRWFRLGQSSGRLNCLEPMVPRTLAHPMPFKSYIECRPNGLMPGLMGSLPPSYQEPQPPPTCTGNRGHTLGTLGTWTQSMHTHGSRKYSFRKRKDRMKGCSWRMCPRGGQEPGKCITDFSLCRRPDA